MRLHFLLLALSPLVQAKCPQILEGLDKNSTSGNNDLREAIDTACGRRNFTSVFWSTQFLHQMIINIVHSSMGQDDKGKDYKSFVPLYESVNEQFKAMESCEAKEYVRAFSRHQRNFMDDSEPMGMGKVIFQMFKMAAMFWTHPLTVDAQITLTEAMKRGFEMTETTEMRRDRIDVAMNAFDRMNSVTEKSKMSEFYAQLYLIATEKSSQSWTVIKETTSFEEFADWAENDWNATGIAPMEITPAVETLYLQFRTLNNTEAKNFVDWFLATRTVMNTQGTLRSDDEDLSDAMQQMARAIHGHESDVINGCGPTHKVSQCFDALSMEAKTALSNAFPELAAYLHKNGWSEDGKPKTEPMKKKSFFGNFLDSNFRRRRRLL